MNEPTDPRPDDKSPNPPAERFLDSDDPDVYLADFLASSAGYLYGETFRAAEDEYDRSPCGIHLYPDRTSHCAHCARLAASLPDFLDDLDLSRPTWFAQGSEG